MTFFSMQLRATILILIVVLIRWIFLYKLPKKVFLILWTFVIARLAIPYFFNISVKFSFPIIEKLWFTWLHFVDRTPNTTVSDVATMRTYSIPIYLYYIWLIGSICLAVYFISGNIRGRRVYRFAYPIKEKAIMQWLKKNKIKRNIRILQCTDLSSALTYGFIHPVILLPSNINYAETERLNFVLSHELEHIKHFDILWKWIVTFTLCLFWYNPMLWVMYILFSRDIELHCDECVLKKYGINKKNKRKYAMALLDLVEEKKGMLPISSYFSKNATEERILSIMHNRYASALSIGIALLGITVLVLLSFASFVLESVSAITIPLN